MACPGSVGLSSGVFDPESDYAALGTAAHKLGAHCLVSGDDAWQYVGHAVDDDGKIRTRPRKKDFVVDKDMADAVQVYLAAARREYPELADGVRDGVLVEYSFHCPELHELYYGQSDLAVIEDILRGVGGAPVLVGDALNIWDYKHGAGIVIEVERNVQMLYYAAGVLTSLGLWDRVHTIRVYVAQPRGWHWQGPIRSWETSVDELAEWLDGELIPAMKRAETSDETKSGEHCRFCPARHHACPQLLADAEELEEMIEMIGKDGAGAAELTNEQLARFLDLGETMKIACKAARETAFARAEKGAKIAGWKLVKARANREWKEGVEKLAKKVFGKRAFTEPKLLSPAQLEKLPKGKDFATEHSFKPDVGTQLVPDKDARQEAGPRVKSMFKPVGKKGGKK